MQFTGYEIIWLFFLYSILGWIIETAYAAVKKKRFINRGVLNGPVCIVYGLGTVLISVTLWELVDQWLFLFLGSAIIATVLEWFTGRLLENATLSKWWDYSDKKWNIDGYVCIQYSVVWGVLGLFVVKYLNTLLLWLVHIIPRFIGNIFIWAALILLVIDIIGSFATILHSKKDMRQIKIVNNRILRTTKNIGSKIVKIIERRMEVAYPTVTKETTKREKSTNFAAGCSFYKLFLLFVIGAFLGDIVETLFCRFTAGVWMSRSSVVWGPFSVVWGLALVLATAFLYKAKEKSDRYIFLIGTLLGGAYEYVCSVFTELVFGKVFWDYSKVPFNLGGRINLLYCFFWGIAAIVWIKGIYPKISAQIERIPKKIGWITTWILIVFMVTNMAVSVLALIRYDARGRGEQPQEQWEVIMDERFGDERMDKIYPNAISK